MFKSIGRKSTRVPGFSNGVLTIQAVLRPAGASPDAPTYRCRCAACGAVSDVDRAQFDYCLKRGACFVCRPRRKQGRPRGSVNRLAATRYRVGDVVGGKRVDVVTRTWAGGYRVYLCTCESCRRSGVRIASRTLAAGRPGCPACRPAAARARTQARAARMLELLEAGKTLSEIGAMYGVGRERVRQLISLAGRAGAARAAVAAARPEALLAAVQSLSPGLLYRVAAALRGGPGPESGVPGD